MGCLYFTICSSNYLHYAFTLGRSLKAANVQCRFAIFLVDSLPEEHLDSEFLVIPIQAVKIPTFRDMAFKYSILELNTSVKPFCLEHAFDHMGFEEAVYLDPDILVLEPLDEAHHALEQGADCVLTPHITTPLAADGGVPTEAVFLTVGVFNLGFVAFANRPGAREFIRWWREKLTRDCFIAFERGVFVDQKYIDLAPCFMPTLHIVRHPGYNLAYWNLAQRTVSRVDDKLFVNGLPVCFVHFSSISLASRELFAQHQNRYRRRNLGALRELYDAYFDALTEANHAGLRPFSEATYAFGKFSSGEPIIQAMRDVYAGHAAELHRDEDPFDLNPAFFKLPCNEVPRFPSLHISRLYYAIWKRRVELRARFDLNHADGQVRYLDWAWRALPREYGLGEEHLIEPPNPQAIAAAQATGDVGLLLEALSSRSLMFRNLLRSIRHGKRAAREHWISRLNLNAASLGSQSPTHKPMLIDEGIAVYGLFDAASGTGEAARSLARSVRTTGRPYSFHLIRMATAFERNQEFEFQTEQTSKHATALICLNSDNTVTLDSFIPHTALQGRRKIGHWVWELPEFPPEWHGAFAKIDEIWAPSRFVAQTIQKCTRKVVRVVPYAVVPRLEDRETARRMYDLPIDEVVFLTSFDFGSFPARKNPSAAIQAFVDAFSGCRSSGPCLVVKCHGKARSSDADRDLRALCNHDRIRLIDRVLSRQEMTSLQSACDIFISLHRAEGFGLNIAESMALGKLAIATGYSGNVDFMSLDNSITIPYQLTPVGPDAYPHGAGQYWAAPDHEAAVEAMRWALKNPTRVEELGQRARHDMEKHYSFEAIGSVISSALNGNSDIAF